MPLLALCCLAAGLLSPPPLVEGRTFPQVTRLEANNGPQEGGNVVTIHGVALGGAAPVRSVLFGSKPALGFTIESDTTIGAVAPPGSGEAEVRVTNTRGETSPAVPADGYGYDPRPEGPWLGLNGNSSEFLGPVDAFVEHGVAYDRSGPTEWVAGETLAQSHDGLQISIAAGMIPVVTIEYRAYEGCHYGEQCLPTSAAAISEYVRGFISSAREILARYPAAPILFEASNEPWGYGSAAQYAAILASLLPAAARAHLPMERIYAGATGKGWIGDLYAARPQLQREIRGWYLHPYDAERVSGEGIPSLPAAQAEMTSGQNNVIVSEVGFCAPDVNDSAALCASGPAPARDSADAAAALSRELRAAVPFHRAGWLRALIVYSRNDKGWAMQLEGGALTAQGRTLEAFADANP
ncbi:MAG TPA: IPT/TIG domain-containing protein [Solirubrobacteraceae bacterium]|nr:IPT/TIG domain-containing protein [Solirubrobacteraceae bacterium]